MNPHSPVAETKEISMNRLLRTRAARGATVTALAGFLTAVMVATSPAVASAATPLQTPSLGGAGLRVRGGPPGESPPPASVARPSQPGFSIVNGGTVSGTYTIPPFANCGLITPVLNLTITGPGNTISLTLGKA